MRVLTSIIIELEKLQEVRMQATKTTCIQQWNKALWNQQKNLEKWFSFGDYVMWFPKGNKSNLRVFTRKWFGPYKVQYVLPKNIVLLVTIEKFETNHVLVNVNKFKPYKYMEFEVQKQEQQMLEYWGQSVVGVQVENFDMEEEDEDYEIQKPQLQHNEDEKQMKNLAINTIFIFGLQMTNKSTSNNYKNEAFGIQISKDDLLGVSIESAKIFTQSSWVFAQTLDLLEQLVE